MVLRRVTKAALVVNIENAENGGSGIDVSVADLNKEFEDTPSAKATLSSGSAKIGDETAFQESAAHCVLIE